jgi:hypothetical protein
MMRILRGLLGALMWILAAVVGLVAAILCVTVILLPIGLPLLNVARQLFTRSVQLMLPPAVAHPVKTMDKKRQQKAKDSRKGIGKGARGVAEAVAPKRSRNPLRRRRKLLG